MSQRQSPRECPAAGGGQKPLEGCEQCSDTSDMFQKGCLKGHQRVTADSRAVHLPSVPRWWLWGRVSDVTPGFPGRPSMASGADPSYFLCPLDAALSCHTRRHAPRPPRGRGGPELPGPARGPLTLDFSWCSSIWMSVSLVLRSSLAAWRATMSASGFSPLFRPFLDMVPLSPGSAVWVPFKRGRPCYCCFSRSDGSASTAWWPLARSPQPLSWKP